MRAELIDHCKTERIEPPTAERIKRIVDSGIRRADDRLVALVVSRLTSKQAASLDALVRNDVEDDEPDSDVLASIKSSPGNVSLASMLAEIAKLEAVRAVELPDGPGLPKLSGSAR